MRRWVTMECLRIGAEQQVKRKSVLKCLKQDTARLFKSVKFSDFWPGLRFSGSIAQA
jgi:hypothetical protein